ncbi:hypothetical protein LZ683_16245 [Comamonas testosteroni]|uniref:hypothetical protein n=1 Tax=Comamonas testosteroni TaxID=285 RepID=UPI0023AAB27E|nr:hypothetical protein [Comamonas testosteroni]WEE75711.1 hypothetical protein LZ683_16245 [Comamonas testosteroni]
MKRLLESFAPGLLALALLLCLVLAFGMQHFRTKAQTVAIELQQLQGSVATQNRTAKAELERLTAERNAAQARLDQLYQQQEKTDAQAVQEIARLTGEHKLRPVRVRIVSQPSASGAGGCRATGEQAACTDPGAADAGQAYGLLPAANSARLAGVIQEIETLNAAYASCRSLLLHP